MKNRKVVGSAKAKTALKVQYDYIKSDSSSVAKSVKDEIIRASRSLSNYPERYQLDEYYPNNPGNIRKYFRWSYRIVYQVSDETVEILTALHTSQEPKVQD